MLWTVRARAGEAPLGPAQRLLAPARVRVSRTEADRLEAVAEQLSDLGVDLDRFAPDEVAVRGLPQQLGPVPHDRLVRALASAEPSDALASIAAEHHPFPEELHEQRTLLATLDEAGVPVGPPVCGVWTADELARRVRGR